MTKAVDKRLSLLGDDDSVLKTIKNSASQNGREDEKKQNSPGCQKCFMYSTRAPLSSLSS